MEVDQGAVALIKAFSRQLYKISNKISEPVRQADFISICPNAGAPYSAIPSRPIC